MKYQPVQYVAVVVLERRIRKALRSSAGPNRRTTQVGAGT
jgi:hypothetical protein